MRNLGFCFLLFIALNPLALASGDKERVYLGDDFEVAEDEILETIISIGSNGVIRGEVKTLVSIGSQIHLKPTAHISHEFVSIGTRLVEEPGSRVEAEEVSIMAPKGGQWLAALLPTAAGLFAMSWPLKLFSTILGLLLSIGLGFLLLYLSPDFLQGSVNRMNERMAGMFGFGLLAYVLLLPGALCLILTIVGILLLPLYFMLFAGFVLYGQFVAAFFVGQRLPNQASLGPKKALILGLMIFALIRLIPILGTLVALVLGMMGLGSVLVGGAERMRRRPKPLAA